MTAIKYLLLFAAIISLSSCACRKRNLIPKERIVTDTIETVKEIRVRDTVFRVVPDSTRIAVSIKDLIAGIAFEKKGDRTKATVIRVMDSIFVNCEADSLSIAAKIKDELTTTVKKRTEKETFIEEVKYTPTMVKILAYIGGGFLVLVAGVAIGKIKNLF